MFKILVVDDDRFCLRLISDILKKDYEVVTFDGGTSLLEYLKKGWADLILLDYRMPGMDGMEVLLKLKAQPNTMTIPVVVLTAEQDVGVEIACLKYGAEDFITKPYSPEVVTSRISRILELNRLQNNLQQQLDEKTRQMENVMLQAITTVANTVDAKDDYTGEHSVHVARNAALLAKELGWKDEQVYNIYYAGLLHDIGKISVPDAILHKPKSLDHDEWKIMKGHTTIGADILKDIRIVRMAGAVAMYHHERYDGTGYPLGLSAEDIPLEARIIAIADAYDAMSSNRVYRKKLSKEKILQELEKGRGTQFDPYLTDIFIKLVEEDKIQDSQIIQMLSNADGTSPVEESSQLLLKVLEVKDRAVKRDAMKDSLTGIFNRSYAERQINSYLRKKQQGACFMLDLDNFKQVNDRFGHVVGDEALKKLSDMLAEIIGESGVLCRMGGDEFLIFLYEAEEREKLRELAVTMLKKYDSLKGGRDNIAETSLSIGIATAPADGATYLELYNAADKALYSSKRDGKNRYCFYNDSKASEADTREMVIDIHQLQGLMDSDSSSRGSYQVPYGEFQRIYNFIARCVERNRQSAQLLLLSLKSSVKGWDSPEETEEEMENLEQAIINSLRRNDVCTRYSSSQMLVVLIGINEEHMALVTQRIMKKYLNLQKYPQYEVASEIMTINGENTI